MLSQIVEYGYRVGMALDNALVLIPFLLLVILGIMASLMPAIDFLIPDRIYRGVRMIAFVSLCICPILGIFVNHVNNNEFAIYIDSGGKAVLQKPGSGYHFGAYEAHYFSTKENELCNGESRDYLGNVFQPEPICEFMSIKPEEFVKRVKSLDAFDPENVAAKSNQMTVFMYAKTGSLRPEYISVRYGSSLKK